MSCVVILLPPHLCLPYRIELSLLCPLDLLLLNLSFLLALFGLLGSKSLCLSTCPYLFLQFSLLSPPLLGRMQSFLLRLLTLSRVTVEVISVSVLPKIILAVIVIIIVLIIFIVVLFVIQVATVMVPRLFIVLFLGMIRVIINVIRVIGENCIGCLNVMVWIFGKVTSLRLDIDSRLLDWLFLRIFWFNLVCMLYIIRVIQLFFCLLPLLLLTLGSALGQG